MTSSRAHASIISSALLALLLGACGAAPPPVAEPTAAEPAPRTGRALPLWTVRGRDGQTSTLLGTEHVGVHIDEVLPPEHAAALDHARVLMVELDVANVDPQALLPYVMLPPEEDLHDLVPPHVWPRLVSALVDTIPEPMIHRVRPWFVMSMIMVRDAHAQESARREGAVSDEQPSMLDVQIMERARAHDVPLVPLETVDEQGALMTALPTEGVVQYLERAFDDQRSGGGTLEELTAAYRAGDAAALERIAFDLEQWGGSEELLDRMLFARNQRWLDRVEAEVRQGGAFVAVGMAHLIGERGLVRLLEARGYTCERAHADP